MKKLRATHFIKTRINKGNLVENYKFMFQTIHQASRYRISMTIFFTAVNQLFSIFYQVIFLAYFMNAVSNKENMNKIFYKLLFFVAVNVIFAIMNSFYEQVYIQKSDIKISYYLRKMIYKKILSVDIACFDEQSYYNNATFVLNDLFQRVKSILNNISQFVTHILCITVLIGYFSKVDVGIVIISTLPVFMGIIFQPIINKNIYNYKNECIQYERRYDDMKRISTQYEYVQELRTTNASNLLMEKGTEAYRKIQNLIKKYYRKITAVSSISELIGYGFVSFLVTLISVYKMVVVHSVDIALFLPLLGAIAQYTWRASSVINTYSSILNDNIYLNKFNEFYRNEPKVVSTEKRQVDSVFQGVDIQHVYFRYNDQESYVLQDINMKIRPKQKIAIVGYNGAGKTTLIHLLLRLYDPVQGQILLNGCDIKKYAVSAYQKKYGVIFQEINIYATSIANNISMGPERYSTQSMDEIMNSLHLKEKINNFSKNYDTQLTHEIDNEGTMLSMGQCQCLALARIFIHPEMQIYILDEPTSALDPLAEEEIFKAIDEYFKDQTVIYISHRFSVSKIADKIYFMDQGRIVEEGTHEELLGLHGAYAEMFHLQAKYYQNSCFENI